MNKRIARSAIFPSSRASRIGPIPHTDLEQGGRHCDCRVATLLSMNSSVIANPSPVIANAVTQSMTPE
ncbi:hypothetical protein, partial [Rhodoferax sp.]|uniref:hypothetical protein n=1 Tax=Rhodoferax sp. TaxID=50421 RepID=UPI0025FC042F